MDWYLSDRLVASPDRWSAVRSERGHREHRVLVVTQLLFPMPNIAVRRDVRLHRVALPAHHRLVPLGELLALQRLAVRVRVGVQGRDALRRALAPGAEGAR